MKNEIWKDIPNYEGCYQVSNLGRVKSLKRKNVRSNRILTLSINSRGYLTVHLYTGTKLVHQLVAMAFLDHTPNGCQIVVDHINNKPKDNRLENLQIITSRENSSKDKVGYTSKFIGVYWNKQFSKWRSLMRINGKLKHLGYFNDELEAAEAYQKELKQIPK